MLNRAVSRRSLILGTLPVAIASVSWAAQSSLSGRNERLKDDTDWLNRELARGMPVQLEEGRTYRTTASVVVPAGGALIGANGSVIAPDGNFAAIRTGGSDVLMRGFTIRGNLTRYVSGSNHGIFVDWRTQRGSNVRIDNVQIEDVAGAAIIALASRETRSSGLAVIGCRTSRSGAHGIIAQDYVDDVTFEGNYVEASGLVVPDRPGITASRYGRRVLVRNNTCVGHPAALGNSVHGISLDICQEAVCTGNTVSGWTKGYGIEAGGVAGGQIMSNRVSRGNYGIALSGAPGERIFNSDLLVSDNVIEHMSAAGLFSIIHGGDGRLRHERVTLRANQIAHVSGPDMGIGAYLIDIDHLVIEGLDVTDCLRSGVAIQDCPNHRLQGIYSHGNNASGNPSHAGLAVHWLNIPAARRGTNALSSNRIESNGGGRNVVNYVH